MARQPGEGGISAATLPVSPDLLPCRKNLRMELIEGEEKRCVGHWGWKERKEDGGQKPEAVKRKTGSTKEDSAALSESRRRYKDGRRGGRSAIDQV